jgi:hypothetical protein
MNYMKKLILILILILSLSTVRAGAEHSPLYTFEELQKMMGFNDAWEAHKMGLISEDEHWALSSYIEYDDPIYPEINNYLRTGKADNLWYFEDLNALKKTVKDMDTGIKKLAKLPHNLLSFRGVSFGFRNGKCFNVGETYQDKAFVSTSTAMHVARNFSGLYSENKKGGGILYLYSNTQKHPGIMINPLEKEILLARNLKYKVMDRVDEKLGCHLLVQICVEECRSNVDKADIEQTWQKLKKQVVAPN